MPLSAAYREALAAAGAALITHVGLVDEQGAELVGGTPAYERRAVMWMSARGGVIRPTRDVTFDVPAGATVGGWRGYSAAVGGTDFGGAPLRAEVYGGQGQYTLLAALTAISHDWTDD